jgi:hypothetical protein
MQDFFRTFGGGFCLGTNCTKNEDYYLIYIGNDLKVMDWMTMECFMACFT